MPIKVLVVDDSALVRDLLSQILAADPALQVVGTAGDAYAAREAIKRLKPDVLTLDIRMPRMDGLTFLKNLMRLRPMPVVMVSALTAASAELSLQALELGAVDIVNKPGGDGASSIEACAEELIRKLKAAAQARPATAGRAGPAAAAGSAMPYARDRIIAIGASTGGTEAIRQILQGLPADAPPVVIAQHIPAAFSEPFARRLGRVCAMTVCQAEDAQRIAAGHVYVAPGNRHLEVARESGGYVCRVCEAAPQDSYRPGVDRLFRSLARSAGAQAVGVLLTGMGEDGAVGLLEMKRAGAATLVQDQASSVVWGMPRAALKIGAAERALPLHAIAAAIVALLKPARNKSSSSRAVASR